MKTDEAYSQSDLNVQGKGFGPNDECQSANGAIFRYVQSTDTIAQFDVVAIDTSGVARRLTKALADGGPMIGVAQATLSSGFYGWAQVLGATTVNCLSTCSSSIALYTSGTAGKLDDTTTSQTKIAGITILANITAEGGASGYLSARPFAAL